MRALKKIAIAAVLTAGVLAAAQTPASARVSWDGTLDCEGNGGYQYSCFMIPNPYTASHEVWYLGNTHLAQFDGSFTAGGSCYLLGSAVRVTWQDETGAAHSSNTTFRCDRGAN